MLCTKPHRIEKKSTVFSSCSNLITLKKFSVPSPDKFWLIPENFNKIHCRLPGQYLFFPQKVKRLKTSKEFTGDADATTKITFAHHFDRAIGSTFYQKVGKKTLILSQAILSPSL
jgi:hypothetical protein